MNAELRTLIDAVLTWASTPGPHGGNPYSHDFVKVARRLDGDATQWHDPDCDDGPACLMVGYHATARAQRRHASEEGQV
jgi:hypothetical protein